MWLKTNVYFRGGNETLQAQIPVQSTSFVGESTELKGMQHLGAIPEVRKLIQQDCHGL